MGNYLSRKNNFFSLLDSLSKSNIKGTLRTTKNGTPLLKIEKGNKKYSCQYYSKSGVIFETLTTYLKADGTRM